MKINVGDKILMKKVEDLPEKLKNDEENVKEFKKFASKICTVSAILKSSPLIIEIEEDEEVIKSAFMASLYFFEQPLSKKHHFSEEYFEKVNEDERTYSFGWAIRNLKKGRKVARKGWNGKELWLELQRPDVNSKMTLPYIYLNYPKGDKYHDGCKVPWIASQTDMLSNDWFEVR